MNTGHTGGMESVGLREAKEVEGTGLSAQNHRLSAPVLVPSLLLGWVRAAGKAEGNRL